MKRESNQKERLWQETAGHCVYCGHPVSLEEMETDHIVPLSLGGENSFNNKVCSCPQCNARKGNTLLEEYLLDQFNDRQLCKYQNRLQSLVQQGRLSPRKAELLFPVFDLPDYPLEEDHQPQMPEGLFCIVNCVVCLA